MILHLTLADLVEAICAGIVAGLEDGSIVPARIGHTSLANMTGIDARLRWATDRARNIAQGLTLYEVEPGQ